jgi:hypothetical protein
MSRYGRFRGEEPFPKTNLRMALHRDIFWVGRQWAVTGYGMQAVDQKQKSRFDIEASRLWEDDLLECLSEQRWFNSDDFNAGLSIARARYPEPPDKAASREKAVAQERARPARVGTEGRTAENGYKTQRCEAQPTEPVKSATGVEPAKSPSNSTLNADSAKSACSSTQQTVAQFNMRIEHWPARFTSMWRGRIRR